MHIENIDENTEINIGDKITLSGVKCVIDDIEDGFTGKYHVTSCDSAGVMSGWKSAFLLNLGLSQNSTDGEP